MEWYNDANRDDLVQAGASLVRQAVTSTKTELPHKRPSGAMPSWGAVCDAAGEQGALLRPLEAVLECTLQYKVRKATG